MSAKGLIFKDIMGKNLPSIYKRYQNRETTYYMLLSFYGQAISLVQSNDRDGLEQMYNNISSVLATYAKSIGIVYDKRAYDNTGTLLDKPWNKLPPLRMIATILNMVLTCGMHKKEDVLKVISHHINLGYVLGVYDNEHAAL